MGRKQLAPKLSLEALALDAGFDRTYVSLIERGVKSPTIRAVVKLAEVLEVRPSEIVQRMEGHLAKVPSPRLPDLQSLKELR